MTQASKGYFKEYYQKHKAELDQKNRKRRQGKSLIEPNVEVIFDPDPDCGFPKGAKLNCLRESLRFCSFTPNTLLRVNGKKCKVVEHLGRQTLVYEK